MSICLQRLPGALTQRLTALQLTSGIFFLFFLALTRESEVAAFPPSSSSSSSSGLKGSQQYLQDPWNHEHNYFQKVDVGPHKHGWGWKDEQSHPAHGSGSWPEQATYVQKLYPVFSFSHNLKKLTSAVHSLKPGKHWNSWNSLPAVALFGGDGTPHHVKLAKEPHYEGGWSHNHMSHHIGHTLPTKTHYQTW